MRRRSIQVIASSSVRRVAEPGSIFGFLYQNRRVAVKYKLKSSDDDAEKHNDSVDQLTYRISFTITNIGVRR